MLKIKKSISRWVDRKLTKDEWFKAVCNSYLSPPVYHAGAELPGFPSDEIQINTTGQSGEDSLKEAFIFYQECIEYFNVVCPIQKNDVLLDFGVGWGRIARFFMREFTLENIHGLDVMDEFVDICKKTFRTDNFQVTTPFPPSTIPDEKFNFIVGFSVFSHLSEDACSQWMREFSRILAPGGVVALTTRGRPFFDYCESLKGQGLTGYSDALSNIFEDFSDARERYDRGEFVHSNFAGVAGNGNEMTSDFYGESFIPEKYAETAYSDLFILEKFLYDPARQTHPIMFFRKN